jgi:O-antigen ligase
MKMMASPGVARLLNPFGALIVLLILMFCTGGGSRADIQSLIVLRPISVIFLGYGLSRITRAQMKEHRFLFGMAAAMILLVLLQLVPLPPSIWAVLPGRGLIVDIDRTVNLTGVYRPVSLVPSGTWNSLFALIPPLAVATLAAQLTSDQRWRLLPLLITLGLVSGIVAVMQLGGSGSGSLYLYQVTNAGAAVGLFANRNHQAIFLASLLPMLAAYASGDMRAEIDVRTRTIISIAVGIFLVPLILITGSRAGLIAFGLGLLSVPLLYRFPKNSAGKAGKARWLIPSLAIAATAAGLGLLTILLGRAEAFDRVSGYHSSSEFRLQAWGPVLAMAGRFFPIGSGFGSFVEVYRVYEPDELLNVTYFNHAHNDWLEVVFTGGLPACLLLAIATFAFFLKAANLTRAARDRDHVMASLGMCVVLLFAMSSITDYPLRVPSLAGVFCVASVWASAFKSHHVINT